MPSKYLPTKPVLTTQGKRATFQRRNLADSIVTKGVSPVRRHVMCLLICVGESTPSLLRGSCSKCTSSNESYKNNTQIQTEGHAAKWWAGICQKYQSHGGQVTTKELSEIGRGRRDRTTKSCGVSWIRKRTSSDNGGDLS